jgi:hypothetical protein
LPPNFIAFLVFLGGKPPKPPGLNRSKVLLSSYRRRVFGLVLTDSTMAVRHESVEGGLL